MSNKISISRRFAIVDEWVINLEISDRAFRLYAVLARYADNSTHKAFPSRDTLAARLRCSKASVDRAVTELVEARAIEKKHRAYNSVLYTVLVDAPDGVIMGDESVSSRVSTDVISDDDVTRTTELEPNNLTSSFNEFWELYPRKMGKGEARGSFQKAVNRYGLDVVMDGVRRLASDPNLPAPQFVPRASTWLNQERWDDEPYPKQDPLAIPGVSRGVRPAAEGPVRRLWVRKLHDEGEHYECKPGEFGCK